MYVIEFDMPYNARSYRLGVDLVATNCKTKFAAGMYKIPIVQIMSAVKVQCVSPICKMQ